MPAPILIRELTVRSAPALAWVAKARLASRAAAGTTEERTIFCPGRANAWSERAVRVEVRRRETRERLSREAEANFVKELLMSMSRYSGAGLEGADVPRGIDD